MSLAPGSRLGSYEIVAPLGSGGMGEVYRAHDTRLRRDVAIKVLPVSVADDPERLRRFEQEALATAALETAGAELRFGEPRALFETRARQLAEPHWGGTLTRGGVAGDQRRHHQARASRDALRHGDWWMVLSAGNRLGPYGISQKPNRRPRR